MGLDYDCCLFVGTRFLPHCMEDIVLLFEEVSYHLWAETEDCQFLYNLGNQFLELWRVESGNEENQRIPGTCLTVVDCILPELRRQREEDLRVGLGEVHHCADRSWVLIKA